MHNDSFSDAGFEKYCKETGKERLLEEVEIIIPWRELSEATEPFCPIPEAQINNRVWQMVASIPQGRVSTYGAIAQQVGIARAARRVGRALKMLPPGTRVPWHRVVSARGRLSLPADSASHRMQRERLENEGVAFRASGTINLDQYGW